MLQHDVTFKMLVPKFGIFLFKKSCFIIFSHNVTPQYNTVYSLVLPYVIFPKMLHTCDMDMLHC